MSNYKPAEENEPEDPRPSKSQRKRDIKAITELGARLLLIPDEQLSQLPYPEIVAAVIDCKKINKGNARKRQIQYIGKQLRQVELQQVYELVDRFDASTRVHATHFQELEDWRNRLLQGDRAVLGDIFAQLPDIDRQHLRQLVRLAVDEQRKKTEPPVNFRKLFQYLKSESERRQV